MRCSFGNQFDTIENLPRYSSSANLLQPLNQANLSYFLNWAFLLSHLTGHRHQCR
jgi:hypothetical protein